MKHDHLQHYYQNLMYLTSQFEHREVNTWPI